MASRSARRPGSPAAAPGPPGAPSAHAAGPPPDGCGAPAAPRELLGPRPATRRPPSLPAEVDEAAERAAAAEAPRPAGLAPPGPRKLRGGSPAAAEGGAASPTAAAPEEPRTCGSGSDEEMSTSDSSSGRSSLDSESVTDAPATLTKGPSFIDLGHPNARLMLLLLGGRDVDAWRAAYRSIAAQVLVDSAAADPSEAKGMFIPPDTDACQSAKPSDEALRASAEEHQRANPPPEPAYSEAMRRLSEVVGEGAAGKWTDIDCGVTMLPPTGLPKPAGSCDAAAAFAERLLMEWGSGDMKVGWGRVGLGEIPGLFLLQMWYFFNWWAVKEVYRYWGAPIIRATLESLDKEGTTIFVGHDSDMMMLKGALGLEWDTAPYPLNVTLPGSMLRFIRDGDQVSASYAYVGDFNSTAGEMR
ncbi:unnamed protein product, partial [Prorocentrum cordatum]